MGVRWRGREGPEARGPRCIPPAPTYSLYRLPPLPSPHKLIDCAPFFLLLPPAPPSPPPIPLKPTSTSCQRRPRHGRARRPPPWSRPAPARVGGGVGDGDQRGGRGGLGYRHLRGEAWGVGGQRGGERVGVPAPAGPGQHLRAWTRRSGRAGRGGGEGGRGPGGVGQGWGMGMRAGRVDSVEVAGGPPSDLPAARALNRTDGHGGGSLGWEE